jgi:ABC-type antimicrobial peptide transport system permease subunit
MTMVVRSASPPESIVEAMQRTAGELTTSAPVHDVRTLAAVVSRAQTSERFLTTLIGVFAALGLVLASLGIYGVLANAVTERTQEIGIRMALGARGSVVLGEVIGHGLALTGVGLLAGAALSLAVSKALSGVLYEVRPGDPRYVLAAMTVLAGAAAAAAWLPARRASRVDPMVALRVD